MRRLRWLTVVIPAAVVAVYVFVARSHFERVYQVPGGGVLIVVLGTLAAYLFSRAVFGYIGRLQRGLEERNRALSALYSVAAKTASSLLPSEILDVALQQTIEVTNAATGGIFLLDETSGQMKLVAYRNRSGESEPLPGPGVDCGCQVAMESKKYLVLTGEDPRCRPLLASPGDQGHCISVPIVAGNKAVGAMFAILDNSSPGLPSQMADELVAIGQLIGTALENARLREARETIAVLQERNRVALELHDGLAQALGYIALKAETAQNLLRTADQLRAQEEISGLRAVAGEAFRDVREAILDLRTTIGPSRSFFDALREYLRRFNTQNKMNVRLNLEESGEFALDPTAQVQLLRIVQEALNNVRKHAAGSNAAVTFANGAGEIYVTVEDDGPGFDTATVDRVSHQGLAGMEERARVISGGFRVDTAPGKGTRVIVTIPKEREYARTAPAASIGR